MQEGRGERQGDLYGVKTVWRQGGSSGFQENIPNSARGRIITHAYMK